MSEGRSFSTVAVVSAVTGRLLCPLGDLYDLLSYLVGRPVFTHEIPEACRMALPSIVAEHPGLGGLDLSHVTRENWRDEAALLEARFGTHLLLHPLGWNRLADADPVDTLVEMVGEDRVIVVDLDTTKESPRDG